MEVKVSIEVYEMRKCIVFSKKHPIMQISEIILSLFKKRINMETFVQMLDDNMKLMAILNLSAPVSSLMRMDLPPQNGL